MNIVITAGGTNEKIDEVRHITNMSSGKLGLEIFSNLDNMNIFYIYAKGSAYPKKTIYTPRLTLIEVSDTKSVETAVKKVITENKIDFFIHAMAISDYRVDNVFSMDTLIEKILENQNINRGSLIESIESISGVDKTTKISSKEENMFISLKKTTKIVDIIKDLDENIFLISFKLLNGVSNKELIDIAHKQLIRTKSNLVIANDLNEIRTEGSHKAYFVRDDASFKPVSSKKCIGKEILKVINEKKDSNV